MPLSALELSCDVHSCSVDSCGVHFCDIHSCDVHSCVHVSSYQAYQETSAGNLVLDRLSHMMGLSLCSTDRTVYLMANVRCSSPLFSCWPLLAFGFYLACKRVNSTTLVTILKCLYERKRARERERRTDREAGRQT